MLGKALRVKLRREDQCPGCGFSFGYSDDFAGLLAAVQAHLVATNGHGEGLQ